MATIPSIGDILMLSQVAWKIGRAFTAGRKSAPTEFVDVEKEVNGLAKSLKLLAETLFGDVDDSIITRADERTKAAVATILLSCERTLKDLESLVEQYQIIKKTRTTGGFSIERSWSDLVISEYRTMIWTRDDGNIDDLRHMLHMHSSTIALTGQALQRKSLGRLEQIVQPLAEGIDDIHDHGMGELGRKIQEVHQVAVTFAGGTTPTLRPQKDKRLSHISALDLDTSKEDTPASSPLQPAKNSYVAQTPLETPELVASETSSVYSAQRRPGNPPAYTSTPGSAEPSVSSTQTSPLLSRSPMLSRVTPSQYSNSPQDTNQSLPVQGKSEDLPHRPRVPHAFSLPPLPPPALPTDPETSSRSLGWQETVSPIRGGVEQEEISTIIQQEDFEKSLFRNAAILSDGRGIRVEYTLPVDEIYRPGEFEVVEVARDCRICVVRKRETGPGKKVTLTTSAWAFSNDRTVRFQATLPDGQEIVPYTSYFSPEKVSVTVETDIKLHDVRYGSPPLKEARTNWVNYVFDDISGANVFQNVLMGRKLLGSYQTEGTYRIHEGLSGVLAYQEMICAMENLRLWEDEDSPGVLAMVHYSARFREGYLTFYLNSSVSPVRVKDEGDRTVKIKGLKIPVDGSNSGLQRKDSVSGATQHGKKSNDNKKWVMGVKVEFRSEAEKMAFLAMVRDVQRTMVPLPELC